MGALQCSKVMAFLFGVVGIILSPIYLLTGLTIGDGFGIILGLFIAVMLVTAYPLFGFILGLNTAAIYNLTANFIGGIEITLESIEE